MLTRTDKNIDSNSNLSKPCFALVEPRQIPYKKLKIKQRQYNAFPVAWACNDRTSGALDCAVKLALTAIDTICESAWQNAQVGARIRIKERA